MVYPENFEGKIGFDRIRSLLAERCISPMGAARVEEMSFSDNPEIISEWIESTNEFQQILKYEENFPSEHYYRFSDSLNKIRTEGTFPEVQEVFDLKRSLETLKSILGFFRSKAETKYPVLRAMCSSVKTYPYVLDAIDRIIDRHGAVKDNASPELKKIRDDLVTKTMLVSKRLNAILRQAQADGIVEADTSASVRNGRGVIPVSIYDKRKIRGLVHDQSASGKTVFIEPEEIVEINNDIIDLGYQDTYSFCKQYKALY